MMSRLNVLCSFWWRVRAGSNAGGLYQGRRTQPSQISRTSIPRVPDGSAAVVQSLTFRISEFEVM